MPPILNKRIARCITLVLVATLIAMGAAVASAQDDAAAPQRRDLETPTTDGSLMLLGRFTPPATEGAPVVILIPGLDEPFDQYSPVENSLRERGVGVALAGVRGTGRSTTDTEGRRVDHRDVDPLDAQVFVDDVTALVNAVRQQSPGSPVALLGSRVTANAIALMVKSSAASERPQTAVLLSPASSLRGLAIEPSDLLDTGVKLIVVHGDEDIFAGRLLEFLQTLAQESGADARLTVMPVEGEARGIDLLNSPNTLNDVITRLTQAP